jgi:ParB family chromosome partitioning protein
MNERGERRRPGERSPHEKQSQLATSSPPPTLLELGLTKTQSSRWQQLADMPEPEFEEKVTRHVERAEAATSSLKEKPATYGNSADEEYYTPREIIEAARRAMGSIDLDPASCATANEVVQAATFYTREDNGLLQSWEGNVFCNPPYTKGVIEEFIARLLHFYDEGHVTAAIVFSYNNTETKWFQSLIGKATAICFPEGRMDCWSARNTEQPKAIRGSAIFYLGPEPETFCAEFRQFGHVLQTMKN